MSSYIIIWQDSLIPRKRFNGNAWPGHAAMNIGKHFTTGVDCTPSNYVSWWPDDEAEFDLIEMIKSYFKLHSEPGSANPSILSDLYQEEYLPDHIIEIPSTREQEKQMLAWWQAYASKAGERYSNIWNNCATLVVRTLESAGVLTKNRKVKTTKWRPTSLYSAVLKIKGNRRMNWSDMTSIIEAGKEIDVKLMIEKEYPMARSGEFCSLGVPVKYQEDARWDEKPIKKKRRSP